MVHADAPDDDGRTLDERTVTASRALAAAAGDADIPVTRLAPDLVLCGDGDSGRLFHGLVGESCTAVVRALCAERAPLLRHLASAGVPVAEASPVAPDPPPAADGAVTEVAVVAGQVWGTLSPAGQETVDDAVVALATAAVAALPTASCASVAVRATATGTVVESVDPYFTAWADAPEARLRALAHTLLTAL